MHTVLFDPLLGPYHVLPVRVTVNLGAMAVKGYSKFTESLRLESHHLMVYYYIQHTLFDKDAVGGILFHFVTIALTNQMTMQKIKFCKLKNGWSISRVKKLVFSIQSSN